MENKNKIDCGFNVSITPIEEDRDGLKYKGYEIINGEVEK